MTKDIEGFTHHTIDDVGNVTNLKTGNVKSHWLGANGYYHVDIQEKGIPKKYAIHRLLAKAFIPNTEGKRTVNHKDGDKLNNKLDNLEWATDKENIQHAYDTGLQPYRRNYELHEYDDMLTGKFLLGESLTSISKGCNQSLTSLSYYLREAAERNKLLPEYEKELVLQKNKRMKLTGKSQRVTINLRMLDVVTGKLLKSFSSVTEAKEYLGRKSCGPISNVLAGRQKTAYGYMWKK